MKKPAAYHPDGTVPVDLQPGMAAKCLDRSRRGGGNHGIFLIESSQKQWVVKCYGHKRNRLQRILSTWEHRFSGRSALDPQSRFRTEKETLKTWRQNGFDVFQPLNDLPPLAIRNPYLVFEYVAGRTLKEYFLDREIEKADKLKTLRRFVPEWSRRHRLALETENHCLIQERATFQHVFMSSSDERLIYFDFEIVYTPRHSLRGILAREIAGYLRSLYTAVPPDDWETYLETIIDAYPHREFLHFPYAYFFKHPNRLLRFLFALDRQLPRNRRPHSKYNIADRMEAFLKEQ